MTDDLDTLLDRRLRQAQHDHRLPSVSAAAFRAGEVVWQSAVGLADVASGTRATTDHRYRIGSITKTFTAIAIMQLRDEGLLSLDAPLRSVLPEFPPGPTIRQALSHATGLQREPPGEIWERFVAPNREELVAGLEDAERVLAPGVSFHYSNLVFGLLGEVVARLRGSYEETLQTRILDPLGLTSTSLRPTAPLATPYYVDPFSDTVGIEKEIEARESIAGAGWLWSTPSDLARWADVLAVGADGVIARSTLDEMSRVHTMVDESWTVGFGLGLMLARRGDVIFVGHGGAMPGFLASVVIDRKTRCGAAIVTNTSAGFDPYGLALGLAEDVLADHRPAVEEWAPGAEPPEEIASALGIWWIEGDRMELAWLGGRLRAYLPGAPEGLNISWFVREDVDRWRIEEGRERGEVLRFVRGADGTVERLYLATYPMTREPSAFGSA